MPPQHLLAALGSIIAVPLVIGNVLKLPTADTVTLVNAALLVSGLATIVQCRGLGSIGIRLPCVMGTSFTFVAAALALGWVSFDGVKNADMFAVPQPLHFGLSFPLSGIIGMSIAYLVTALFSSFSQNIGVISLTGVAGRYVLAGLFPVFGALIVSVSLPVLGGAGLMMLAMIIAAGIQMLDTVERSRRNGLIIAISIGCGLAVTTRPEPLDKLPHFFKEVLSSGITVGSLLAIILNLILPEDKTQQD